MLNANEPEATIADILTADQAEVNVGDLLITIETTKAAADIEAETSGIFRLAVEVGDTLRVGDVFGYITESPSDELPVKRTKSLDAPAVASELRITTPAKKLAEANNISLTDLPKDQLITEAFIRGLMKVQLNTTPPEGRKMVVYGAGGHAKALIEMIRAAGVYEITAVVDDDPALAGTQVLGLPILGGGSALANVFSDGVESAANGVGGIIDQRVRKLIFDRLIDGGFYLPSIVNPKATVELSAKIGFGTQVFANAYVGSEAILADLCMINTGAVVSHDCVIGSFTHIAPGALLAGGVTVGENVLVGMGVTTAIGVTIHDGARVGNGAIILKDVPARKIIAAGEIWR